ncbi:hypothetical protein Hdeb2414_s0016g00485281 [Helianthus debilis subsp. tardiflorus]
MEIRVPSNPHTLNRLTHLSLSFCRSPEPTLGGTQRRAARRRERERSEHGERERRRNSRFPANRLCGGRPATHLMAARLTAASHSTGDSSSDGD